MTISTSTLTSNVATSNGVVTGDGVFDDLMETVNTHLENQFQLGRITGTDYATVYLGALQSTIQQASQFVLQAAPTNEKIVNEKLQSRAELYIAEQKLVAEKLQNGEEINQYIWEVEYNEDTNNTYTFTTIQNLTDNDVIARLNFDPHVLNYTVKNIVLNQVTSIAAKGDSIAGTSIKKAEEEIALLSQKAITEYAQTHQTDKVSPDANSLVGRQGTLYDKQANGFEWDAKNTHNKNLVDLQKMKMNVSGYISPNADGTGSDTANSFGITDPTT